MKITIIGDGGWGTALALLLHKKGYQVTVWGPFQEYIEMMKKSRENHLYLPGVMLPEEIALTFDRREAIEGSDIVVMAVPSRFYRDVAESFTGLINKSLIFVSVSKGFDPVSHRRLSEVLKEIFRSDRISVLSGPSHAEEVARNIPTAVVAASENGDLAEYVQNVFSTSTFRVYSSCDVIGVELGGALKNIIAIATGMSDGLGFGDNTRAALVTRGLAEITRLGIALGASPFTFSGLSGIGDLVVTCTSRLSRNRMVGERLGKGEKLEDILKGMKQVAEGIWTCSVALMLARKHNVDVPITEAVYNVISNNIAPSECVEKLMSRSLKMEISPEVLKDFKV